MPRELYINNIAYLHKRVTTNNTIDWEQDGTPFYCNREIVKHTKWNPIANTYSGTAEEVLKTTTQLPFEINDKITFSPQPLNSINDADTSLISGIDKKPYMERGNKQRNTNYFEYWITKAG